ERRDRGLVRVLLARARGVGPRLRSLSPGGRDFETADLRALERHDALARRHGVAPAAARVLEALEERDRLLRGIAIRDGVRHPVGLGEGERRERVRRQDLALVAADRA